MAYKVRCSHCGKSMMLPEGDAGLPVVCLACGTKFVAPGEDGESVPPQLLTLAPIEPKPTVSIPAIVIPSKEIESPKPLGVPWALIAIAAVALLVIGGMAWQAYQWNSSRSGARELTQLLSEARSLASAGDLKGASERYRAVERRAIELGSDRAKIRKLADEGRFENERILASLVKQPVIPPPATLPSTIAVAPTSLPAPATREFIAEAEPPPAPTTTTAPTTRVVDATPATTQSTQPTSRRAGRRPPLQPVPEEIRGVTDEEIGEAIQRGVDRLIKSFNPDTGQLRRSVNAGDEGRVCGLNALCVYALLQSGQAINDQRLNVRGPYMKSLMAGMKAMRANSGTVTYARGIRATALALYNRSEDRAAIRADVQYLLASHNDGRYSYVGYRENPNAQLRGPQSTWDNSNSQYGLLGVWSGAEVGVEVPSNYWSDVLKHWQECQQPSGMWGYTKGGGTLSMTAAGTASMFVAEDYLYGARFGAKVGREPFSPGLQRALNWWETGDNILEQSGAWWGYTLYGIERVGLASGFKYFGKHDWYRELAGRIVAEQGKDGTWNDLVDTSYALLFLARGRHPILMNKLRFDKGGSEGQIQGYWANRPRDAANLARYAGRKLERPLNWQVVTLEREWHDWLDSPILSIASHRMPYFVDADIEKFRQYVEAGGMIYLQSDGESKEFDDFARRFMRRVFPQYATADVPLSHVIYSMPYKVDPPPPLQMVTNGARILILYSSNDISRAWQMRDERSKDKQFELGTNMFIYAAGKRELRNRLSSPYVPPLESTPPLGTIDVARVEYGGSWDPEPGAWRRFADWFARQTGTGLNVNATPLKNLSPTRTPFAHLTGSVAYQFKEDEIRSLNAFVNGGGILFVDSCGGSPVFTDGVKVALTQAFPNATLSRLPRPHPLLEENAPGMDDLTKPRLRLYVTESGQTAGGTLEYLKSGNGAVILSSLDVTSGLLGTQTWGIAGFDPGYAQSLMKNVIFWTVDGKPGL